MNEIAPGGVTALEDSYSILPALVATELGNPIREAIVHHSGNGMYSIRQGPWKLIRGLGSSGFSEPRHVEPEPAQWIIFPGPIQNSTGIDHTYLGGCWPDDNANSRDADLFIPPESFTEPRPAILYIHGGSWSGGSPTQFYRHAAQMAGHGIVGSCCRYRFSGEATFPASVEDVKAAIRWLRASAEDLGIDRDRIGVLGGSSGGPGQHPIAWPQLIHTGDDQADSPDEMWQQIARLK